MIYLLSMFISNFAFSLLINTNDVKKGDVCKYYDCGKGIINPVDITKKIFPKITSPDDIFTLADEVEIYIAQCIEDCNKIIDPKINDDKNVLRKTNANIPGDAAKVSNNEKQNNLKVNLEIAQKNLKKYLFYNDFDNKLTAVLIDTDYENVVKDNLFNWINLLISKTDGFLIKSILAHIDVKEDLMTGNKKEFFMDNIGKYRLIDSLFSSYDSSKDYDNPDNLNELSKNIALDLMGVSKYNYKNSSTTKMFTTDFYWWIDGAGKEDDYFDKDKIQTIIKRTLNVITYANNILKTKVNSKTFENEQKNNFGNIETKNYLYSIKIINEMKKIKKDKN